MIKSIPARLDGAITCTALAYGFRPPAPCGAAWGVGREVVSANTGIAFVDGIDKEYETKLEQFATRRIAVLQKAVIEIS